MVDDKIKAIEMALEPHQPNGLDANEIDLSLDYPEPKFTLKLSGVGTLPNLRGRKAGVAGELSGHGYGQAGIPAGESVFSGAFKRAGRLWQRLITLIFSLKPPFAF